MTLRLQHRFTALVVILVLVTQTTLRAADEEESGGTQAALTGAMIDVGTGYIPPAPIERPEQDRANNNGAAIAAAAIGAAVAGLSCIMLMKQAKEEEDPEKKKQLMMQALQQCAQAAQQALSAAQNNDQKKKLQKVPESPSTTIATMPFNLGNEKKEDDPALMTLGASTPSDNTPADLTSDLAEANPLPEGQPLGGSDLSSGGSFDFSPPGGAPAPPAAARLGVNEDAPAGGTTGGMGGGMISMGSFGAVGARPAIPDGAKFVPAGASIAPKDGAHRGERGLASADGGAGGGEDSSGGGSLESMMAGLFGGKQEGMDGVAIGSGADILSLKGQAGKDGNGKGTPPNIFEYASYRYKKATYQEGKVRARATAKRAILKPVEAAVSSN